MQVHKIERKQIIPAPVSTVWDFFSDPGNLAILTPPYMKMKVTSGALPEQIYAGQIITYRLFPFPGIPVNWMTEITQVVPGKLFVDEQRKGPYKIWHHEHHFEMINGQCHMTDIVHYVVPLPLLGALAHSLFIKRQLDNIFDYRQRKVAGIF
jgi:ligand-binding SRPBCC domain-containing protein